MYRRQLERNTAAGKTMYFPKRRKGIIALAGEMGNSADKIYSMFSDADLKFEDAC
ncbi:hypothetical protein [Ruminococcus albus]|uniref:hypothetical protein n=1 Tax=Ruminococcus albus TaxID=1264 RepID=UPI001FA70637|nr:hypothetical protein [Ruminococcus albus]